MDAVHIMGEVAQGQQLAQHSQGHGEAPCQDHTHKSRKAAARGNLLPVHTTAAITASKHGSGHVEHEEEGGSEGKVEHVAVGKG